MKNIINILYVSKVAGFSKKSGKDYDLRMAQCVVEKADQDGNPTPMIGELLLPEKFKDTAPGRYEVTFEVAVSQDKRIGSVVASMAPAPAAGRSPAPVPAAAAATAPAKA
jgi:hypothetical protein